MLRDVERGVLTEAEHILGFMLNKAREASIARCHCCLPTRISRLLSSGVPPAACPDLADRSALIFRVSKTNSKGYWLEPIERLFQVAQEVSLVLKPHQETDKIVSNAALQFRLRPYGLPRANDARRVHDERFDVAETDGECDYLEIVQHMPGGIEASLQAETHHPGSARRLLPSDSMPWMRWKKGVIHPSHGRMGVEHACDCRRAGAVTLHSRRKRLQSS